MRPALALTFLLGILASSGCGSAQPAGPTPSSEKKEPLSKEKAGLPRAPTDSPVAAPTAPATRPPSEAAGEERER